MAWDEFVTEVRGKFTRLRLQANHDSDALKALVDLMAYLGARSQPMQESKVFLKSMGWWPMDEEIFDVLHDHVVFDRGNIVWRGFCTDGQPAQ